MATSVPFLDLPRQHRPLLGELGQAISALVAEARFIGGAPVAVFEQAFAQLCQSTGCVGVANGTDALMLALRVLGVGHGDVVILPAHTFIATAEAVTLLGAVPRLVDIDSTSYTMSPEALANADPTGVKAVVPVHLYGQTADMGPIVSEARKRGYRVIEDAAQAHGAEYDGRRAGSLGDLAAFSFYPGKNLGAFGDGGAVVGSNQDWLDQVRRLGNHGRQGKQTHSEPGLNSRLDAIQAAVLTIKLAHLGAWNERRAQVARWYDERLSGIADLVIPAVRHGRTHVYHLYVVLVPDREALGQAFAAEGIGSGIHYARPVHLQPAYRELGYGPGNFPVAERIASRCLSLPMYPDLEEEQVDRVTRVMRDHLRAGS
jgi:dTDP-4-amino-4,6-dideoxygalactose transaminase